MSVLYCLTKQQEHLSIIEGVTWFMLKVLTWKHIKIFLFANNSSNQSNGSRLKYPQ